MAWNLLVLVFQTGLALNGEYFFLYNQLMVALRRRPFNDPVCRFNRRPSSAKLNKINVAILSEDETKT